MSNLREIKQRIGSVKKTRKITQAMKMVAAAKFKRAQGRLSKATIYETGVNAILEDLMSRVDRDELPAVAQPNKSEKAALIIVSGDRGLCGGFNANILKKARRYLEDKKEDSVLLYLIGTKSIQHFKATPLQIEKTYENFIDDMSEEKVENFLTPIIAKYTAGDIGSLSVFYNEFVSALTSNQVHKALLPVDLTPKSDATKENETSDVSQKHTVVKSDYIYEPDKSTVLNQFLLKSLTFTVFKALLESLTSEQGARMAAMDSATDNAGEVIHELTLQYNRSRQAAITTEISEIIAGAASLG